MLQFLVGGGRWDQKTLSVSSGQATDDVGTSDGSVDDWDDVLELGLEDGVEVLGGADGNQTVGVGEGGENTDPEMRLVPDPTLMILCLVAQAMVAADLKLATHELPTQRRGFPIVPGRGIKRTRWSFQTARGQPW